MSSTGVAVWADLAASGSSNNLRFGLFSGLQTRKGDVKLNFRQNNPKQGALKEGYSRLAA